jgi:hypothetical protein
MTNAPSVARNGARLAQSDGEQSVAATYRGGFCTELLTIARGLRMTAARTSLKRFLMALYRQGLVPAWAVRAAFFLFRLRSL